MFNRYEWYGTRLAPTFIMRKVGIFLFISVLSYAWPSFANSNCDPVLVQTSALKWHPKDEFGQTDRYFGLRTQRLNGKGKKTKLLPKRHSNQPIHWLVRELDNAGVTIYLSHERQDSLIEQAGTGIELYLSESFFEFESEAVSKLAILLKKIKIQKNLENYGLSARLTAAEPFEPIGWRYPLCVTRQDASPVAEIISENLRNGMTFNLAQLTKVLGRAMNEDVELSIDEISDPTRFHELVKHETVHGQAYLECLKFQNPRTCGKVIEFRSPKGEFGISGYKEFFRSDEVEAYDTNEDSRAQLFQELQLPILQTILDQKIAPVGSEFTVPFKDGFVIVNVPTYGAFAPLLAIRDRFTALSQRSKK